VFLVEVAYVGESHQQAWVEQAGHGGREDGVEVAAQQQGVAFLLTSHQLLVLQVVTVGREQRDDQQQDQRRLISLATPPPTASQPQHTHPLSGTLSRTTQVSWYQKGKTNLDFTEARDSEWQWHQLGHMQVCTSIQTDNHASTPPLRFLQAGCPSCRPTNSVKALKAHKRDRI